MCYHLFCFTDLIDLKSQINGVMWSFCYTIALLVLVNVTVLAMDIYKGLHAWWTRRKVERARKLKLAKKKEKETELVDLAPREKVIEEIRNTQEKEGK